MVSESIQFWCISCFFVSCYDTSIFRDVLYSISLLQIWHEGLFLLSPDPVFVLKEDQILTFFNIQDCTQLFVITINLILAQLMFYLLNKWFFRLRNFSLSCSFMSVVLLSENYYFNITIYNYFRWLYDIKKF